MIHFTKPINEELNIALKSSNYNRKISKQINYLNKKFIKPWGYEYLCFQNENIGIWILHINENCQTSLHCHYKKDTILIPLHGSFKIDLYNYYEIVNECDIIYCPSNKFHGIKSYIHNGIILEIEIYNNDITYSDKNDLLRIMDTYNRDKNNYESSVEEIIINENESVNFHKNDNYFFGDSNIKILNINNINEIPDLNNNNINILLEGKIVTSNILCAGSIIKKDDKIINILSDNIKILCISNIYINENSKLIYNRNQLEDLLKYKNFNNIGLTSGCFDIIHIGHINNLKMCKMICNVLFVCLSSDKQIRELKGIKRPINSIEYRKKMLSVMSFIDYIVLYHETDNNNEKILDDIMNIIKPEYWFKGSDYKEEDIRKKHPCLKNIKLIDNVPNNSTTMIINNIQNI